MKNLMISVLLSLVVNLNAQDNTKGIRPATYSGGGSLSYITVDESTVSESSIDETYRIQWILTTKGDLIKMNRIIRINQTDIIRGTTTFDGKLCEFKRNQYGIVLSYRNDVQDITYYAKRINRNDLP